MLWIYRLLFIPIFLLLLPQQVIKMWRRGGYCRHFFHRFGCYPPRPKNTANKKRVWIQAVSVGEVIAIGPLLDELSQEGAIDIILTVTTSTGYQTACQRYADKVSMLGYFPFDFWPWVRRAWQRLQPDAIILTESELWPEHLNQARKRCIPAFLINARLSDRSYRRYQLFHPFALKLLSTFTLCYAASEPDRERFISLGLAPARVHCFGNIKLDQVPKPPLSSAAKAALCAELGFACPETQSPFILVGASTWPGEESFLMDAQAQLIEASIDCRLLLVPRHAERGPSIVESLQKQSLSWHQRSNCQQAAGNTQIYLADTTGELNELCQIADLVFIGKSLPPHREGQTPIEAARIGLPIIMGSGMSNFKAIAQALLEVGAACSVSDGPALIETIQQLHKSPDRRKKMAEAATKWYQSNQGSSARIAQSLIDALA